VNGYICMFGSKRFEVYADNTYQAQQKAIEFFKPSKSKKHLVTVHLAEKNGETVTHTFVD
jgi:hypothetical protein